MQLHAYLFQQWFAEAEAECVLVEHGTCHEGANTVQQLFVLLYHKSRQNGREVLGENGARLKTAVGTGKRKEDKIRGGSENADLLFDIMVSCYCTVSWGGGVVGVGRRYSVVFMSCVVPQVLKLSSASWPILGLTRFI